MKVLRLFLMILLAASLYQADADPKHDCLRQAKANHKAAHDSCNAKNGAQKKDCQQAAKKAFEAARKNCK